MNDVVQLTTNSRGEYDLQGVDTMSITLDSLVSNAGYNNTVGFYYADADGNPISGQIMFANVKDTLGEGNEAEFGTGRIPEEAVSLGFFIIPNGDRKNKDLDDGEEVTFELVDDVWTPFINDDALKGASNKAPAFFSNTELNADGFDHVRENGDGTIGFEDLYGGGDKDFEDSVLAVSIEAEVNEEYDPGDDIDSGTDDDDDSDDIGIDGGDEDQSVTLEALDNGNYDISEFESLTVELDSLISRAGYKNTVGIYFADENGDPISGIVAFENVKKTLGVGKVANLTVEELPEGAVEMGFFIIPNGFRKNKKTDLEDGSEITFELVDDVWTPYLGDNALKGASKKAAVFFSNQELNADGFDHVQENEDGTLGFEDLYGGGDKDFEDVVIDVDVSGVPIDVEDGDDGSDDGDDNDDGDVDDGDDSDDSDDSDDRDDDDDTGTDDGGDGTDAGDNGGTDGGGSGGTPGITLEGTLTSLASTTRLLYQDMGQFELADMNGDGQMDIVSVGGTYGSGMVWFDGIDMSLNRLTYVDLGDLGTNSQLTDFNGDGQMDVVTDAFGGLSWIDSFGTINRITYNQAGDWTVTDANGDGLANEIVSIGGSYQSGASLANVVWYDSSGAFSTVTYNDMGNATVVDIDGDGIAEIVSNNGAFQSGTSIDGLVYYELDGSSTRINYNDAGANYQLGQFDGDAELEVLVTDGMFGGSAIEGAMIFDTDGTVSRVTYNDLGDFRIADMDGDGVDDIVSINGAFQSGATISGMTIYGADGSSSRFSYLDLDNYQVADINGDGVTDVVGNGGIFPTGLVSFGYDGLDDTLVGTVDDDTIIGGGGNDTLTGGAGADSFVFNNDFDQDTITDFELGIDTLSIQGVNGFNSAADVVAAAVNDGSGNTIITLGGEGIITLLGVDAITETDVLVG